MLAWISYIRRTRLLFSPVSVFSCLSGQCKEMLSFPVEFKNCCLGLFQTLREWLRKHEFERGRGNGCTALSHFVRAALFVFFAILAVLLLTHWPMQPPSLCIPTFLSLCLSIAQTDSSDNSDLEDDIILSLNEWGATGIWDRGTGQHVKASAS